MHKMTYDAQVDAAYIKLVNIEPGSVAYTIETKNNNIMLDFNKNNELIGIEVLSASKTLPKEFLEKAEFFK